MLTFRAFSVYAVSRDYEVSGRITSEKEAGLAFSVSVAVFQVRARRGVIRVLDGLMISEIIVGQVSPIRVGISGFSAST